MATDATAGAFVRDLYGDRAGPLIRLAGGDWSQAYAFRLDQRDAVIRFGVYGDDFAKDAVMSRFSSTLMPVPKILDSGRTPSGFYCVSERARGAFLDRLSKARMEAALPHLFDALDALRQVEIEDAAGYGLWLPSGSAPHATWRDALLDVPNDHTGDRVSGWRARLETSPTGSGPFDVAFDRLMHLSHDLPDYRNVVHSDLLYRNVLAGDDGRLAAVFDWGNSLFGDPLYDAAWLIYWWPWYPAWRGIDIETLVRQRWSNEGDIDLRLTCCQLHIGMSAQAYNAFRGRWDDLARNAAQTLAIR